MNIRKAKKIGFLSPVSPENSSKGNFVPDKEKRLYFYCVRPVRADIATRAARTVVRARDRRVREPWEPMYKMMRDAARDMGLPEPPNAQSVIERPVTIVLTDGYWR